MAQTMLVIGASGFLGSHVTRQLVERGDRVRVLVRPSSSTVAFDDLDVDVHRGELTDVEAIHKAIIGCDVVFHCVVDTRAFLYKPEELFKANVDGLRTVLDAAVGADLTKFVFTSTIGTIGLSADGSPGTEDDRFNWTEQGGEYIRSRVMAENMVLEYARDKGLPAVAMCVSNTYGPGDYAPTMHGGLIIDAAAGRRTVYALDLSAEVVGVEDAAAAMLLAAERGRVGERYIISESYMSQRELYETAAEATSAPSPRGVPLAAFRALGLVGDGVRFLTHKDLRLCSLCIRLLTLPGQLEHSKAERELGWHPTPTRDHILRAVEFYRKRGMLART
jgi:dihydroflavonol-4-reductase